MVFIIFISLVILLRICELFLAKRNEQWLLQHGAVEYGKNQYPFMITLHVFFFVSLIIEYLIQGTGFYSPALLFIYIVVLGFKIWVIFSLGKFWNTKIYRIRDFPLIKQGPYNYVKHPNYIAVMLEIALIPLIFKLYFTAVIFTVLNGIMLYFRIKEENKALGYTDEDNNMPQKI
jgi:methyltransferase